MESENHKTKGTLQRGLSLLQYVAEEGEASVIEAANEIGLSRSTAYRIVETLREWGFLEADPSTGRCRLGAEARRIGLAAIQSIDLMQVAPRMLEALVEQTQESCNLAVFDSGAMVIVYRQESARSVTTNVKLGSRWPLHATGLGKAYLAALPDEERRLLTKSLTMMPHGPNTILKVSDLRRDLKAIEARGWAHDRGELDANIDCYAAAILDHTHQPIAAISTSGPVTRLRGEGNRIGPIVAGTAAAISRRLGHPSQAISENVPA